ncbi:DNA internalization-related competence protein ComEC/Rec2 [Luteimonas sp. RD2P54]|uniref:DNA internalization-related competence protein ComEC/Rec2 n=1 Tax=Luteimonas endophytica TaxID=3042023 RepID=A0ABT6JC06_9GAMM|nr:DNA internalization-related competence protein ComEC/Rec2 [Luteimonas endophytica]MDH5824358.1 DNA internalization-related competence protein ComEC/Rec2 [Luteimonas endophytica]
MDGQNDQNDTSAPAPFGIAVALALAGGVAGCLCLPALPPWPWLLPALALGLAGWWARWALRPAAAALAGFALCGLHAWLALALQLPPTHERGDFEVEGRVVQLPEHGDGQSRFLLRVERGAAPPFLRGRLVRLSWYDGWDGVDPRRFHIAPGSRWRFTVRLRAPRGLRNPGWFDSEKHALARRLAAVGYVRDAQPVAQLSPPAGVDAWRDGIARRIDGSVPSASSRYVRALALGDTRRLGDADWEILRATGLTHLIAISGFHVGLVAGFFALLAAGLWRLLPGLGRRLPRPQAAACIALAGALLYAAVAGWALPTVRTVLMIAVLVAARLWRRPLRVADSLALAAVAVLLADPLSVLAAGFWLSFAGVAWLAWCLPDARGQPLLRGFLSAQWVATLGLLPLSAVLFGQASLAGPLANLVAIPWWSLVVVPLSLLGTGLEALHGGAGGWAWRWAAWCFDLAWPLFEWLAAGRFALWWLPEARWYALPLALLGAFWLLLPRAVPGKALAALLWLPLLWPDRHLPRSGEVELVMLDVGQGLSVLVRTARHSLLYDMGPAVPDGYDAGERVVLPALQALGVQRLDALVVSHGDADHAGGLGAVRRRHAEAALFAPHGAGIDGAAPCLAGHGWEVDGVRFRFLHPGLHFPYLGNEASCVLRVEGAHGAALLVGDIGEVIERGLLREDPAAVRADVVTVAHHGSDGSSDAGFVAATGAAYALLATGHGNRFGFPREIVLRRWRHAGARILDTAPGGALRVRIGEDGVAAVPRRESHPRLWDAARRLAQGRCGFPAGRDCVLDESRRPPDAADRRRHR